MFKGNSARYYISRYGRESPTLTAKNKKQKNKNIVDFRCPPGYMLLMMGFHLSAVMVLRFNPVVARVTYPAHVLILRHGVKFCAMA